MQRRMPRANPSAALLEDIFMRIRMTVLAIALASSLCPLASHAAIVEGSALPERTVQSLRFIQANADVAGSNARDRQWRRVNREVDRIVARANSLATGGGAAAALSPEQAAALRDAVAALRSARAARDAERVRTAAEKLSSLCADLLH